jgi:hypothetical protein
MLSRSEPGQLRRSDTRAPNVGVRDHRTAARAGRRQIPCRVRRCAQTAESGDCRRVGALSARDASQHRPGSPGTRHRRSGRGHPGRWSLRRKRGGRWSFTLASRYPARSARLAPSCAASPLTDTDSSISSIRRVRLARCPRRADFAAEIFQPYLCGEYLLSSRRPGADDPGGFLDRRSGIGATRTSEQHHEVVVALARDLTSAPGTGKNNSRVTIDVERGELLSALAKSAVSLSPRGRDVEELCARHLFETSDPASGAHT